MRRQLPLKPEPARVCRRSTSAVVAAALIGAAAFAATTLAPWAADAAALHYSAGISVSQGDLYLTDKTYRPSFSWDAGVASDFAKRHAIFLSAFKHARLDALSGAQFEGLVYLGGGLLYRRDNRGFLLHKDTGALAHQVLVRMRPRTSFRP